MDALPTMRWVLYALIAVLGIGWAGFAAVADRRPRPEDVEQVLDHAPFDLFRIGLLRGGVIRAIDARLVDLVGWPAILSGLETLLETGRPLPEPEPAG